MSVKAARRMCELRGLKVEACGLRSLALSPSLSRALSFCLSNLCTLTLNLCTWGEGEREREPKAGGGTEIGLRIWTKNKKK
jgi:hypothetical protein